MTYLEILVSDGDQKLFKTMQAFDLPTPEETREAFEQLRPLDQGNVQGHHLWVDLVEDDEPKETITLRPEQYQQVFGLVPPTLDEAEQLDREHHASRRTEMKTQRWAGGESLKA